MTIEPAGVFIVVPAWNAAAVVPSLLDALHALFQTGQRRIDACRVIDELLERPDELNRLLLDFLQ